ncbi:U-box domain-containing protein [Thalictrum thalictroides]|uniref:RING-type E3 ubiquitin transferase n=1 Tax=Thalictrum thalictroides TaxID=46969 RepID=A0A7J6W5W0_THATH|nr:U-box domain-containing protein [Thalictrum thalictroides]
MESLHISPPFQPDGNYFSKLPSFNLGLQQRRKFPEIADENDGDKVYVAVGKSIEKSIDLIQWTFQRFGTQEIVLLHVHQPSSRIPTLLGKLPVRHANEELVSAHRREEKEQCKELLFSYLNICSKAKVKATIVMTESEQVQKGIVELVNKHASKKLVMGALLDIKVEYSCMKATNSTTKAGYVSKNSPPFCEIWFVSKGKHVWTREASADLCLVTPMHREWLRSNRSCGHKTEHTVNPTFRRSHSVGVLNWLQGGTNQVGVALSADESSFLNGTSQSLTGPNNSTQASGFTSAEIKVLSQLDSKLDEENDYNQMLKARAEAVHGNDIAFAELLKRKKLEYEALEANNKKASKENTYLQMEMETIIK